MSKPAHPQRTALVLSSLAAAVALGALDRPAFASFFAAGCTAGPNHLTAASTQAQVTNALNAAIGNPALLVTADATGMAQSTLGTLGQFNAFVDTDGVFGTFIITSSMYTGASTTALATRIDGLLSRTCATASVTVDAAGMGVGAVTAICNRISKVDAVLNLAADKTLILTAANTDGKTITGAGTVSITADALSGDATLVNVTTGTLCFPAAAPYFSIAPGGRLVIQANRVGGCSIEGPGTLALTGGVDGAISIAGITAPIDFDTDGSTGTTVSAGSNLSLRADQANGLGVSGAGTTSIAGDIAASTDLTRIASELSVTGQVSAAAQLLVTAAQANGRAIAGAGTVAISPATSNLADDTDLRGISTPGLALDGSIAAGKTLSIGSAHQSVTVAGAGTVAIDGTAGDDTIAPSTITAKRVMRGAQGDDSISGGATVDAALFAASLSDAGLGAPGTQFTVTTPAEGTDTVSGVEELRFADATVVVVGSGSVHGTLNAALAATPSEARLYGALHVDKDSFTDAASLTALLARVVGSSVLTAELAGMSPAQIAAINGAYASFASVSGGSISIVRGGATVGQHLTLDAAVDAAAAGDAIVLGAGEFTLAQQLVVGKNLAIVGNGAASTRIRAVFSSGATGDARALIVCAAGHTVDLRGLTVDAAGVSMREGLLHKGSGTVLDCSFVSIAGGGDDGIAIRAEGNLAIRGCSFASIGHAGALFTGAGVTTGVFETSTYTGKGVGTSAEYGVIVSEGASAAVRASTISNNLGVSIADGSSSAGILVGSAGVSVSASTITGNAGGVIERSGAGAAAEVSVSDSNLSGNGIAVSVRADATATCNWWGTVDADAIADLAPGSVRYSPFSASQGGACSGEGKVLLDGKGRSYASVSAALAAAVAGDTLRVATGEFADGALVVDTADLTIDTAAGAHGYSLVLGSADSIVLAGAGDLDLTGNARANLITANLGANALDGGAGIDTAVLGGAMPSITGEGSLLRVGIDTVTGIEILSFGDASVLVVGRAGSEVADLNAALVLGGGHRLYGQLAIDHNSFASGADLTALLARFVAGSAVSVDVLGMNAAQLAAIASHAAQLPAITYPPIEVSRAGAAAGYFASLADGLAFAAPGDTVILPAGSYSGPIVLDKSVSIAGAGAGTILTSTVPGAAILTIAASGPDMLHPIVVRDLSLQGAGTTGIALAGANHVLIERAVVGAVAGHGIDISGGDGIRLADTTVAGTVRIDGPSAVDLGNTVLAGLVQDGGASIDATGVQFTGSGGLLDRGSLADLFRIEDAVEHRIDAAARGFVRVVAQSVYLSRNSGSLSNALASAAPGDTIYIEDGSSLVLTSPIAADVRFAGAFTLTKDSFPAGPEGGAVLASFLSRGAVGAHFAAVTTGMSPSQLAAIGAHYAQFDSGVSGAFALSSAQSAAEIASLLSGAGTGSVTADATGMSPAQLAALAAAIDRIAAEGLSGRIELVTGFDLAVAQALITRFGAATTLDVDALGMEAAAISDVLAILGSVDLVYNLVLTDAQSEAELAALLAKSIATGSDGRSLARAVATAMSTAKLGLLAANGERIAADGITGSITLAQGALDEQTLVGLLSRTSALAIVRIDATALPGSTLSALSARIGLIDSLHGLSLDASRSAAELANLLSRSDLADAVVLATGMDSLAGGRLAAVADRADRIAAAGLRGALVLDSGLTAAQLAALLGKLDLAGGGTAAVGATGMSAAHMIALADALLAAGPNASSIGITGATLVRELDIPRMAAILGASAAGSVTIDATGMNPAQLEFVFAGSPAIGRTIGSIAINAATSLAQIQVFLAHAGSTTVLDLDPSGMTPEQLALINATPLMIVESHAIVNTGEEFIVDVNLRNLSEPALGMQARVVYDTTRVEYIGGSLLGGTDFPVPVWTNLHVGVLSFATGVSFDQGSAGTGIVDGNAAKLRFRALVPFCVDSDVVSLSPIGFANRITSANATEIPFTGANSEQIGALDSLVMTGVSDLTVDVPADAGTTLGAAFPEPSVSAFNSCSQIEVVRTITLPDGGVLSQWPSHFAPDADPAQDRPTVVTWTVSDESGTTLSATHRYTVRHYQVADIDVNLAGSIAPAGFTQNMTVRLDTGDVVVVPVAFTGGNGAVTEARLPIRADYTCMQVQDVGRTLAAVQPVSVEGTRYAVPGGFSLVGGDSNGDNMVDVLDFSVFIADFGFGKTPASRSNYNRDDRVHTADFAYIGINFLRTGERCTSNATDPQPLERVTVRDLRRMGLGDAAKADLNGDGWVDANDIAQAMQGGLDQRGVREAGQPGW